MKQWLIGEGIWSAVDPDAAIVIITPATSTPTDTASTTGSTTTTGTNGLFGKDIGFGANRLDARAQYQLINCINDNDQEYVSGETTARGIWMKLVEKYKETLETTGRQYIKQLTNYKKSPDLDIQATFTDISKKSRKVAATSSDMKAFTTEKRRFQILLDSLPPEYDVIRDAIDAQDNPNIQRSIKKLKEKEQQLKEAAIETAMWARDNDRRSGRDRDRQRPIAYRIPQRRHSDSDGSPPPRRNRSSAKSKHKGCFLCDEDHRVRDCPLLHQLKKLAKRSKGRAKEEEHAVKRNHKAYNAEDSSASSSASSLELKKDIDSENEEDIEEIAALSKELVSRIPKSDWIADTGASSHMTDQLRLFSGLLTSIRRRTIKVGGGKLYSDQCGTAVMRAKNGECRLTEVLYVPDLGVSLLSGRRFTKKGLMGSFNDDGLYMHTKQGIEVLRAPARDANGIPRTRRNETSTVTRSHVP